MSNFLFLNPWILGALAALPALWFLLKIMPPAPQKIILPSARFLDGLVPKTRTPSKTPWWILLLRLIIAGLIILACAQPVLNPSQGLNTQNPIRLIIDNGWSSADIWEEKIKAAEDILAQAERAGLDIYLMATAPEEGDHKKPLSFGPLSPNEARSRLKGLEPHPWKTDLSALIDDLKNNKEDIDSLYFSDGIETAKATAFINTLKQQGDVKIFLPKPEQSPLALKRGKNKDGAPQFQILTPEGFPKGTPLTLQAYGSNGDILGIEQIKSEGTRNDITLNLPDSIIRKLSRVRVLERNNAAAFYLFGDQFNKKRVGIVSPSREEDMTPFVESGFYLTRALEPFAELKIDTLDAILSDSVSMIILPDTGALLPEQLERLESWVRDGGLLLRFAGPVMEQARQHFLTPTKLRQGARSLDGALRWETPPILSDFSELSPLAGIIMREDITVQQQILADPSSDLEGKVWARLDDGTPLITADSRDAGMIVMVHTSASPDWSNLPLSGAYVQILSRLVSIAGSPPETMGNIPGIMEARRVLDGYGQLQEPSAAVKPLDAGDFERASISSQHPAGLYVQSGTNNIIRARNLGDDIARLTPFSDISGVDIRPYGNEYEVHLMPQLLLAALALLLVDWLLMLLISGQLRHIRLPKLQFKKAALITFIAIPLLSLSPAHAQIPEAYKYADGLYLGFIKSKNAGLNANTRKGLEALSENLKRRTSAEPDGVIALDPESDILSFFPLIYWPIDAGDQALSADALRNVQHYLDHGGTILFDTRETSSGAHQEALARVSGGLNIPALSPIEDDHVLGRSFYLLNDFPGLYSGGTLWLESNSGGAQNSGRDGVSSVIIGSHDWASAWANYGASYGTGKHYRAGSDARQKELAMRTGVNIMMYALTGNYKADQLHVKNILERLGQ